MRTNSLLSELQIVCFQLLEEVESEHGFVGSVMVSAKQADGCADDAIQSLVRCERMYSCHII